MKLLIVCCLVAGVFAEPPNYYSGNQYQGNQYQANQYQYQQNRNFVPITSENNEINPDGSYQYSYTTGDGQQAQASGYVKNVGSTGEGQVSQGSYSYTAPDGTPITVNWVADENGFRASGAHLPTPPPIPEAIQKSLNYQGVNYQQQQYNNNFNQYNQQQAYRPNKPFGSRYY